MRITKAGTIYALEVGGKRIALDAPLLEHSPDPDVAVAYLGDRSAELRVCRIAALHLNAAALSRYLVILAPALPLADIRVAASGITVDGKPMPRDEAVAACKATTGADVVVTGDARQGNWDDLRSALDAAGVATFLRDQPPTGSASR